MRNRVLSKVNARETGAGLVEVLVAVLVFSVGMLGVATMQLAAKKNSYEATQRSIATGLARDILERMRSNPGQLNSYVADDIGDTSAPLTAAKDCSAEDCTTAELAAYDLADWYGLLIGAAETVVIDGVTHNAGGLVESRACITNSTGNVMVAIAWLGVNEMTDNIGESDCGVGDGLYGADDDLRRVLVITTYIGTPAP